ncbi:MAG: zf-HC2 domain-containing protein [Myxococcota bacterium]|jgi:anti-sigma factor (TIGR02949 family)
MKCEDVKRFVHIYLDGEMEPADSREFQAHLAGCAGCDRLLQMEKAVIRTIKLRAPRVSTPAHVRMAIEGRVLKPGFSIGGLFGYFRLQPAVAMAAAASILLVIGGYFGATLLLRDAGGPGEVAMYNRYGSPVAYNSDRNAGLPRAVFTAGAVSGGAFMDVPGLSGYRLKSIRGSTVVPKSSKRMYLAHGNKLRLQVAELASYDESAEGSAREPSFAYGLMEE